MVYRTLICLVALSMLGIAVDVDSSHSQALSTVCDNTLRSTGGGYGYVLREADKRCEGNYESDVASTRLELVSMTFGPVGYGKEDPTLAVSVPPVAELDITSVSVRGTAIPRKIYYRMDAVLAPGDVMHWPLRAVIHPSGLEDSDLGVLAWADVDDDRLYLPVNVQPAMAGGSMPPPPTDVLIKLVSTHHLEHLHWRLKGEGAQAWAPLNGRGRTIKAGRPVLFSLPVHLRGEVKLEFVGKVLNAAGRSILSFRMWRR